VIRPDGRAIATIDGTPLVDEIDSAVPNREVLNGIAVRDETSFWLTGKQWPTLFAIGVVPDA
jgi:glutamine cyclotransferase